MSQAGKVLHLYVEVRSVAEEEGKVSGRSDDGTGHLMLQRPDILPYSQRSSTRSSPNRSPDLSPVSHSKTEVGSHSLSRSKSTSRHSVSFQLQNPDARESPTQVYQQDVLYDSFGHLFQVLAPEMTGSGQHGSLGHTCSTPISPSSTSSGGLTVPSTPISNHRCHEVPEKCEEGKTSVVTFGYIEKANVHTMGGRRTSVCQSEFDNPFNRKEGQLLLLQKRLSDPLWYNDQPGQGNPYPSYPCPSQNMSPRSSPHMQRSTLDTVARNATHRALEEFGSPELRRRFAGQREQNCSPTLPRHYQSPRCRSWAGSPVLPRSTLILPSKAQLLELNSGHNSVNGLPRSPASDRLCAHTGYYSHSTVPTSTLRSRSLPQRPWVGNESPRLPSKFNPPLPAGRPTEIQHEIPTSKYHTSNHSRTGYQSSRCSNRTCDAASPTNNRRSISPSSNAEVACKLAVEAAKLSTIFADRRTPSPSPSQTESLRSGSPKIGRGEFANSHGQSSSEPLKADKLNYRRELDQAIPQTKPRRVSPQLLSQKVTSSPVLLALPTRFHHATTSQSPVLGPRQQRDSSPPKDLSTLHRYQSPQYTGDCKSHGTELRQYDQPFDRYSPELSRRLLSCQNAEALPVSWTSRHQEQREAAPIQHEDENYRQSNSRLYTPSKGEYQRKVGGMKMSVEGYQTPVQREDAQDHSVAAATASQSSSGVTGSMGDSSQLDRNESPSPETSSQSSHDTGDTGSGMQVGLVGG